jgi:hypothetical protein
MLDTYIKNRGTTKTIIHNNNHNDVSEINWDADYDGDIANIELDVNENGKRGHYDVRLTNDDLAGLLNIPSVDQPLDKRLLNDFTTEEPEIYKIEFKNDPLLQPSVSPFLKASSADLARTTNPYTHISSPLPNEEFVIPLPLKKQSMSNKSYRFTTKRHHKRSKTHKTYPVYKRQKTSRLNKRSSRKTKYVTI